MSTSFVYDRASQYGETKFLSDLDPNGDLTEGQYKCLVDAYVENISFLIADYDDSLMWFPRMGEIWGEVGVTKSDPWEFRKWWESGGDGKFADALDAAYEIVLTESVTNSGGHCFSPDEWDAIATLMDEEIREEIHTELAPCTNQEFFDAYAARHMAKYGEQWELDKENPVW